MFTLKEVYYQTGAQTSFHKQVLAQEQMHQIKTASIFKLERFQVLQASLKASA